MSRHRLCGRTHEGAHAPERTAQRFGIDRVDEWIVALRYDPLTEKHGDPIRVDEQLVVLAEEAAARPEQVDLPAERVGDRHGLALAPQRLAARIRVIVEDQEIADALER